MGPLGPIPQSHSEQAFEPRSPAPSTPTLHLPVARSWALLPWVGSPREVAPRRL